MRSSTKKTLAAVVGGATLLGVGGVAYAYWTTSGSGTGTAATGTVVPVTVNQTSVVSGLAPGLPSQPLSGTFDNTNGGPVYVSAVTAVVSGTDKAGCGATDYTITGTATVNTQVAAGDDVGTWSGLSIVFNNKATVNQDACKNAVVTLAYTSS